MRRITVEGDLDECVRDTRAGTRMGRQDVGTEVVQQTKRNKADAGGQEDLSERNKSNMDKRRRDLKFEIV